MSMTSSRSVKSSGTLLLVVLILVSWAGCRKEQVERSAGTSVPKVTTTSTAPSNSEPVSSSGPKVTLAPGTVSRSILTPDGHERTYRIYVPSSIPSDQIIPLVVALHGGTGWGEQFEKTSEFDKVADKAGFLVVYPDGNDIARIPGKGGVWNAGDCCGFAAENAEDIDDVSFISKVIDEVKTQYQIDNSRIYATGHSNGGMLAYRLACELSDKIVAVGIQSGTNGFGPCTPGRPVSLIHIHGTADTNVPINGGKGSGISSVDFNSPTQSVTTMATKNGCDRTPTTKTDQTNTDVITSTWGNCEEGVSVVFVKVEGANHGWMGHASSGLSNSERSPYQAYDSSAEIWTFLAAHPR